jgi:hypothetical protein
MKILRNVSQARQKELLASLKLSSFEGLDLDRASRAFYQTISFFKKGELSVDELSMFGSKFFHSVAKYHPTSDFFQATLSASELTFSVRTPAVYGNIKQYFIDIDAFYKTFAKKSLKK